MALAFSGSYNTAVGAQSLLNNCAGNNNVALGGEAGKSTLGNRNVFIGFNAGKSATGDNKLFIHNGDENSNASLIYGEFDNKLLKINGRTEVYEASMTNASIAGIKNYAPGIAANQLAGVYGENLVDDNLGIGVFGTGSYAGVYGISNKTNSPESIGVIGVASGANTGTNYGLYGYADNAATGNYAVYANGNLAYSGTLTGPSDLKFKRNINSISSVLSKILLLKPSIYMMRNIEFPGMTLPETPQVGFIAQDLQKVFPDLVSKQVHTSIDRGGSASSKRETIDFLGVNYIGMIPILTKGIQEQQELIEKQKAELRVQGDEMKKQAEQISALKARLDKIEKMMLQKAAK
jgi:hypothetical protein